MFIYGPLFSSTVNWNSDLCAKEVKLHHNGAPAGPRRAAPHYRRRAVRSGDRHNRAGHRQRCGWGKCEMCDNESQQISATLYHHQPTWIRNNKMWTFIQWLACALYDSTTVVRLVMFRAACRYTNVPWGDCDPNSWMRTKTVSLIAEDRDRWWK